MISKDTEYIMSHLDELPDRGPNGFTKLARRVLSVLSMFAFFGLLSADFILGVTTKPIPIWMYVLLFSAAAAGWGPIFNMFSGVLGVLPINKSKNQKE